MYVSIANNDLAKENTTDFMILTMENISEWLIEQLNIRDWSKAELARKSGLDPSTISNIINGKRGVSEESLNAIARAFHLPPGEVFQQANFLPQVSENDRAREELRYLYDQLSPHDKEEALEWMRFKAERSKNTKQTIRGKKPDRTVLME